MWEQKQGTSVLGNVVITRHKNVFCHVQTGVKLFFFFFLSPVLFVRVTILVTLAVENKHGEMVLREPRRLLKRNSINRVRLKKKRSENEKNPSWHRRTITKSVVDTFPDFLKNGFLRGSSLNP